MVDTPSYLSDDTVWFDFPVLAVRRGTPNDVMDELAKLQRQDPSGKTEGQAAAEAIAEIDSLHEPTPANRTGAPLFEENDIICVECWTVWPCATHRAIYGETKDNCVHRI